MNYIQYLMKLKSRAQALQADSRFETVIEIERGFDAADFRDLQEAMDEAGLDDVGIWPEFRRFHECVNGFLFQWLLEGGEGSSRLTGSAQVLGVQQIYLPEYAPSDEVGTFYDARRTFDRISPDEEVAVRFDRGADGPCLEYLSDLTGRYHPIRLDLPAYLEALLECRALYRWQECFIDDPDYPHDRSRSEAFVRMLLSLFPDADASIFRMTAE